jgi:hypothetical protein
LGTPSDDVDLTNVFVDLDLSASDFNLKDGKLTIDGVHEVKLPDLAEGQTLTLKANDLEGQLVLDGDGTLLIKNDFNSNGPFFRVFDLTEVTATVSFDDESVNVADGSVLILRPDQADEKTIGGAGIVAVVGNINADDTIDLLGISTRLSFSDDGQLPSEIALGSGAELLLNATQADGQTITAASDTAEVKIYKLELSDDADFSDISGPSVVMYVSDDADFDFTGDLGGVEHEVVLGANAAMSLASGQADGRTITGGATSSVYVRDLTKTADLSELAANMTVTAEVSSVLDLSDNTQLGSVDTFTLVEHTNGRVDLSEYAGKTVNISLTSAGDRDTVLFIYDANGVLVANNDHGGIGDTWNSLIENQTIQEGYYAILTYNGIVTGTESVSDFSDDTLVLEVDDPEADETTLFNDTLQALTSSLTLTADQADAQVVTGVGDVHVTGLTDNGNGHLATDLQHHGGWRAKNYGTGHS